MIIELTLFAGLFLALTAGLQQFSKKTRFPYTVALLIVGLIGQYLIHFLNIGFEFDLDPEVIFFVLLPLLLFESALHINFHQFRLQFKTITFLATFGLLASIFTVGAGLAWIIGLPLGVSLLFGAMISATDPIAVLALFKNLGAPKRLALLTEGESMLNDATAVIIFKLIAGFVVAQQLFQTSTIFQGIGQFLYVFIGSIIFGALVAYLTSLAIAKIKEDRIIETTLTAALAIGSFVIAEHFFHLSGVIATVIAGIYLGNFGKTKISGGVIKFMEEIWEYNGFFAISLIFFFTAFNLNVDILAQNLTAIIAVILVILVARSVAVYASFYFTNLLKFFKDEPNVPTSWQHVINWGGLRGIIPLVLVHSLPDEFEYKTLFLAFTLAAFMVSLLVNALSINWLLKILGLHVTPHTEAIVAQEMAIFALEEAEKKLKELPPDEFDKDVIKSIDKQIEQQEQTHQRLLLKLATPKELLLSLKLQAINIEKSTIEQLFLQGHINEHIYFRIEVELDLQLDALEFPEVSSGRGYEPGGKLPTGTTFRSRLRKLQRWAHQYPILKQFIGVNEHTVIEERLSLLKARIVASEAVINYLDRLKKHMQNKDKALSAITEVKTEHQYYIKRNQTKFSKLEKEFPKIAKNYQKRVVYSLVDGQISRGEG